MSKQRCAKCGAELAAFTTAGVCPACLLERGLGAPAAPSDVVSEAPGTLIGRYKLLEKVGEGGCGVVYMAEQEEPVRRKVALKVIKLGMDTREIVARFEQERQALALMDHPNIARIIDGGATEAGRPYFVMELVKGIRLTDYCDQHKLSTRQRLDLFAQVCHAIQHAHQKGIIHRDIKPSNILVTLHDGVPVPKVIDFGIAKAIDQRLTDKTLFTQLHQFMGTPAYMSPEQAELSGLDIDTRTDIYSLGVLLYQLLTGRTPFDAKELLQAGFDEMRRKIREDEPQRPSTRISTLAGMDLTALAAQQQTDPRKLTRLLHGDLDWIVMKALEKDRTRRYETASGFALDIRHYLADEPVTAAAPTAAYRFGKFARRNKTALGVGAAFAALLLVATVVSTTFGIRAHRDKTRAVTAEGQAQAKAEEARASAEKATARAAESQAVLNFFRDKILAAARPENEQGGLGREVTVRRAVESADPQVTLLFTNMPKIEARIRHSLGGNYLYLGDYSNAIRQFERALTLKERNLGSNHAETLVAMDSLGKAYKGAGRLAEAVPLLEQALERTKAAFGTKAPNTIASMITLAGAYMADLPNNRLLETISLYKDALELCQATLGPENAKTIECMNGLAVAYHKAGKYREALPLFQSVVEYKKAVSGPEAMETLTAVHNLASAYQSTERLDEALPLYRDVLKIQQVKLGPDHPSTLATMNSLAWCYNALKRFDDAIRLYREAIPMAQIKLGVDHNHTLEIMNNLATAYGGAGQWSNAVPLRVELLEIVRKKFGSNHWVTLNTMDTVALTYSKSERESEANSIHQELLTTLDSQIARARIHLVNKQFTNAVVLLQNCVPLYERSWPTNSDTFIAQSLLGWGLIGLKKFPEAQSSLVKSYDGLKKVDAESPSPAHAQLIKQVEERFVNLYDDWKDHDAEAVEWRKKLR